MTQTSSRLLCRVDWSEDPRSLLHQPHTSDLMVPASFSPVRQSAWLGIWVIVPDSNDPLAERKQSEAKVAALGPGTNRRAEKGATPWEGRGHEGHQRFSGALCSVFPYAVFLVTEGPGALLQ